MTSGEVIALQSIKEAVGNAAAQIIQDGMLVGLGTGSTAACFIQALALRCRNGLRIKAVPTSAQSEKLALANQIPLVDFDQIPQLDITVDGADEIDPKKQMIKGGGGALLREKIVASSSKEMIVIVDESKLVAKLGKMALPVDIVCFGYRSTIQKIEKAGFKAKLRMTQSGNVFITDDQHYVVDVSCKSPACSVEEMHRDLIGIPGVVETGFFSDIAGRVIVGYSDGRVEILP